jgi:hypothetical protein
MKLLILGLILISVILTQIYYTYKNKESFKSDLDKALVTGERNFMLGQDKYWDVRNQGIGAGLVKTKPGINTWMKLDGDKNLQTYVPKLGLEQRPLDQKIVNCRALTKCSQIANNSCGYCAFDKEFRFGTKDGPSADVCPAGGWTTDATECQKLREKEICSNVKSCGDLYGEAAKICGYCATTGKAMVMMKKGDKLFPKYADDVCGGDGYGLLTGDKCGAFLKDHPCITPTYLSGPHSAACVKKLWGNAKCTNTKPYNKSFEELGKDIQRPYKEVGVLMQNVNNKTHSTDYAEAVTNSDNCFGNNDNIKPCDTKYSKNNIPHPACLRKEFKDVGCTEKGTGYKLISKDVDSSSIWTKAKKHVEDISKYSKGQDAWNILGFKYPFSNSTTVDEYKDTITRVNDLTVSAGDYPTRKATSLQCLGESPKKPDPIKPGDTVSHTKNVSEGLLIFEGIVTGRRGDTCKVMWTKTTKNGKVREREGTTLEDQKKYWGWDGIPPTVNIKIKGWINISNLNSKVTCSDDPSTCKLTCNDKIRAVLYKYPRPRDCIVGSWGAWSSCSKSCGTGQQIRTRRVLYPPRYGGGACPTLENKQVCNTSPCFNKNFTEDKVTSKGVCKKTRSGQVWCSSQDRKVSGAEMCGYPSGYNGKYYALSSQIAKEIWPNSSGGGNRVDCATNYFTGGYGNSMNTWNGSSCWDSTAQWGRRTAGGTGQPIVRCTNKE